MAKRDAEMTRRKLLDAGEKLFVEKGLDGTRVDQIATEAGVNKRMLYAYFGSKDGFYRAVLLRVFQRLRDALPIKDKAMGPRERLISSIRWYCNFLVRDASFARLMYWAWAENSEQAVAALETVPDLGYYMGEDIEEGIEAGVFRTDVEPTVVVFGLSGAFMQLFGHPEMTARFMNLDVHDPDDREGMIDQIVAVLLRGVDA